MDKTQQEKRDFFCVWYYAFVFNSSIHILDFLFKVCVSLWEWNIISDEVCVTKEAEWFTLQKSHAESSFTLRLTIWLHSLKYLILIISDVSHSNLIHFNTSSFDSGRHFPKSLRCPRLFCKLHVRRHQGQGVTDHVSLQILFRQRM